MFSKPWVELLDSILRETSGQSNRILILGKLYIFLKYLIFFKFFFRLNFDVRLTLWNYQKKVGNSNFRKLDSEIILGN